jgi:hypothetical protein
VAAPPMATIAIQVGQKLEWRGHVGLT